MELPVAKQLQELTEVKENISSILILFIIMLLTVDYYSMFDFGFEFKHFNYILDYKELITINLPIITIFLLLAFLSKKHSLVFFLTLSLILIIYLLTYDSKPFEDIIVNSFIYAIVIFIFLAGTYRLENYLKKEHSLSYENHPFLITSVKILLSCFFTFFIINIYTSSNENFNNIYKDDTEYHFSTNEIQNILLKSKVFTTNRLENIQDDISFTNSKLYVEKLKELNVLTDNQFKINDNIFYSTYLKNNNFKTLFIVDKRTFINNKITLHIIFTEKISENKYQILNILEKKINVEYKTKSL